MRRPAVLPPKSIDAWAAIVQSPAGERVAVYTIRILRRDARLAWLQTWPEDQHPYALERVRFARVRVEIQ